MEVRPCSLWTGAQEPRVESIALLPQERVRHIRVHTAEQPLTLLIAVAVMQHRGVLYTSWAQAPVGVAENGPEEHVRGRRSRDDGATWTEAEVIAPPGDKGRNHSSGSFLSCDGELLFFASTYVADNKSYFGDLQAEAFVLDEAADAWVSRGIVAADLYPMDAPRRMPNGNWIMGGLNSAARAAVAVSDAEDLLCWRTISLPQVPGGCFGETTVVVGPDRVLAIARPNKHVAARALVYESADWGENWTTERVSNFPMTPAKPSAGILSTGRMYMVSNLGPDRSVPIVAVGEPGELTLNGVYRLRPDLPAAPRECRRAFRRKGSARWECVRVSPSCAEPGVPPFAPHGLDRSERPGAPVPSLSPPVQPEPAGGAGLAASRRRRPRDREATIPPAQRDENTKNPTRKARRNAG